MFKATDGAQAYALPAGTKVAGFGSVVVGCKIVDVLFAPAPLAYVAEWSACRFEAGSPFPAAGGASGKMRRSGEVDERFKSHAWKACEG